MTRQQLEHILRAASGITGADSFVIVGSQAVLGQFPNAPPELLVSMEADLFSPRSSQDAELIDGSIGEESPFHRTFGYYAHGVGEETAILPHGWKERLIAVRSENTGGATGLCLEVHDLAVSKLAAGRDKDLRFLTVLLGRALVDPDMLWLRLAQTPMADEHRQRCTGQLRRILSELSR